MSRVLFTFFLAFLLLSACGSSTPSKTTDPSVRVSVSGVFGKLLQLKLPDNWKATDDSKNGNVTFAAGSGSFTVHALMTDDCTSSYILEQAKMSWGKNIPDGDRPVELTKGGGTYGYSWRGFDGVAGGATEATTEFWCIHSDQLWSDIEIRTDRSNSTTTQFVQKTFVPLWLQAQH